VKRFVTAAVLLLASVLAAPASALCIGSTVVSGTTVQFSTYDPVSVSAKDAVGTITAGCTIAGLLPSFTVKLSIGSGTSYTDRRLISGSDFLSFNLYKDSQRTQIWGDGTAGTSVQSFDALLSLFTSNFPVYGRIPAGQDKPAGTYNSTITVTIEF
jgi:spore coat protein U-like protein